MIRRVRTVYRLLLAIIIISGLFLVYRYNPENCWWMPKCPFYTLTGLQCPSCGNTRALHALLHGNFSEAMAYNAMAPVLVGLFVVISWLSLAKRMPVTARPLKIAVIAYIAIYLIWWAIRIIWR